MIRKLASFGIKAEILQLTFVVGVLTGMLAEAAFMVAAMTGRSILGFVL